MAILVEKPTRCTFIHLEKNGGTSITQWLKENCSGYRISGKHTPYRKLLKKGFSDLGFTFAVVRNPWDRVVSSFVYQLHKEEKRASKIGTSYEKLTFEQWVDTISSYQSHYITKPQLPRIDGVDYVLKFENLDSDFVKIQELLECYEPLKKINTSQHTEYKNYYNERTKQIVEKIYTVDIEKFGYEF